MTLIRRTASAGVLALAVTGSVLSLTGMAGAETGRPHHDTAVTSSDGAGNWAPYANDEWKPPGPYRLCGGTWCAGGKAVATV
jgi:hypothetical protein